MYIMTQFARSSTNTVIGKLLLLFIFNMQANAFKTHICNMCGYIKFTKQKMHGLEEEYIEIRIYKR